MDDLDAGLLLERLVSLPRHQLQSAGEEVVEQAGEDAHVVGDELAEVEVSQSAQQDLETAHIL